MKTAFLYAIVCLLITGCSTSGVTIENRGSGNVVLPDGRTRKVIRQVPPDYPASLRAKQIVGAVVVRFWVRPDGTVARAEARYSPHPELVPVAVAAVEQWLLEPAQEGDTRILMLETPVIFELRDPAKK